MIKTQDFPFEVVGGEKVSSKDNRGYVIYLRPDDKSFKDEVIEKETNFKEYHTLELGQIIDIPMYSSDGRKWFFNELEARLVG